MPGPWTCFHCGDTFTSEGAAALHFGAEDGRTPACQIKASEGGLLRALREAEASAAEAWSTVHAESADALIAWRAAESRHAAALRSAEEAGFERGLRDSSIADGFTYAVQHNPNCPSPFMVRLPRGALDLKPVHETRDAYGYGQTFLEAFASAKLDLEKAP